MDYALLLLEFEKEVDTTGWPRQRILLECLRTAILHGKLSGGTRLMGSRALADELDIARNTVLYAYDQLATQGFVLPHPRGTVVASNLSQGAASASGQETRLALSTRGQRLAALREPGSISTAFAPGVPALEAFPMAQWRRLVDSAWKATAATDLNYGDPAGEPALREAIADYLRGARGVRCDAGQVFITSGTQNSLDICARAFADEGAIAWIENPGYPGALAAFHAAQLKVVGIAVDGEGISPTEHEWRTQAPALIYTTPSHQYPTGGVLGLRRRLDLIEHAERAGAFIIEDDYDSEFRYDGPPLPSMQGLANDTPVLYLGTFSKTMFPALRLAYMVVPARAVQPLTAMLARSAPQGRTADQNALAAFLRNGQFATHLRRMRRLYRQRRDATVEALEKYCGTMGAIHGAQTGMHLALLLNDSSRDADVGQRALRAGLAAQALSAHATAPGACNWNGLLLGYSQVAVGDIDTVVRKLSQLMRSDSDRLAG